MAGPQPSAASVVSGSAASTERRRSAANLLPVSCMPSPESPANLMTTRDCLRGDLSTDRIRVKPSHIPPAVNGLGRVPAHAPRSSWRSRDGHSVSGDSSRRRHKIRGRPVRPRTRRVLPEMLMRICRDARYFGATRPSSGAGGAGGRWRVAPKIMRIMLSAGKTAEFLPHPSTRSGGGSQTSVRQPAPCHWRWTRSRGVRAT